MNDISIFSRYFQISLSTAVYGRLKAILVLPLVCVLLLANVAQANFVRGLNAYENKDYTTALIEWMPLADAGNSQAQYNLGWMYKRGRGVPLSDDTAIMWFEMSAQSGHSGAQSTLGSIYYYGEGVARNELVGTKWFTLAARQGNLRARSELEYISYKGVGIAHGYHSITDQLAGMFGSAFLFMFNPFAWMLVIYLTLKKRAFAQISFGVIAVQMLCVLPFVIYFLVEYQKQEYPTEVDWHAGMLELGVLSFISIMSGLAISFFVYTLLKRKHLENSREPIEDLSPVTEI
ncbi:MAG: tetratricopeptide repeat protein [Gammaproteobacteria bacterium]